MIAAAGIGKRFGRTPVLEAVALHVPPGCCLALLGPNGAGKTTLLRILATLLRPSTGSLVLDGIDALQDPERARARVGLIGHGAQVYEHLTAIENLRFWEGMRGGDTSRAVLEGALRQVELDGFADERAHTFSAGMKRRLGLARLALADPRLLFLDEPYTGLDPRGRAWLGDLLRRRTAAGGALVVATHSFGDALDIADRVAILAGGRVVLDRPRGDLSRDGLRRLYEALTSNGGEAA